MRINKVMLSLPVLLACYVVNAQNSKPSLTQTSFDGWTSVEHPSITSDGKYFFYTLNGQNNKTVLQGTASAWKKEGLDIQFFTGDNKFAVYKQGDSLFTLRLGTNKSKLISAKVSSFEKTSDNKWIAIFLKSGDDLILENLSTHAQERFQNVGKHVFNPVGNALIIELNSNHVHSLNWISLNASQTYTFWQEPESDLSKSIGSFAFNNSGNKIAFCVDDSENPDSSAIYSFQKGESIAKMWTSNALSGLKNFSITKTSSIKLNNLGDKLFIKIKKKPEVLAKNDNVVPLIIWHYAEEQIQSQQALSEKIDYSAVVNKAEKKIIVLEDESDNFLQFASSPNLPIGNYLLSVNRKFGDESWQKDYARSIAIISTKNGGRKIITDSSHPIIDVKISPDEKFVVWYDLTENNFFSYEISTCKIRNISSKISIPLFDDEKSSPDERMPFGSVGWQNDDNNYLIYDRYDIWLLDLKCDHAPVNLLNGYGRKNKITFGVAQKNSSEQVYKRGEEILLGGFNRQTKENGLIKIELGKRAKFDNFRTFPKTIYIPRTVPEQTGVGTPIDSFQGMPPLVASKSDLVLVQVMTAKESPNYFLTRDFIKFKKLSNVHPERYYNWVTSELHSWLSITGEKLQGILYKPENFDPNRKYPIIFYYYREKSDGLNMFLTPNLFMVATINIPLYVSSGYLVFVPDIHYTKGNPGQSVMNSILPAAKYLSNYKFIDTNKMGAMGQSFGGYETNYIVTHTNIFAAACAGSAPSDLISAYGGLYNKSAFQVSSEKGQYNLGVTPWDNPSVFVENSPIFSVKNVQTPLLIWQGTDDEAVPFNQALEMFLNMRRAGKKVWLLQYNDATHGLFGKSALDLDLRMRQFFDHYLKGAPPPLWMTKGISAKYRQSETGLSLDSITKF